MKWRHRIFTVAHSRDGWVLLVHDELWAATAAERAVSGLLKALGHPCCGRGPLGNLGGHMDLFWYRVLNLPNKLYRYNRFVGEIPLTEAQAEMLEPERVAERREWDAKLAQE